ncbi:BppU family phage baseplate upper protein [Bacillus cereus group sp. BfR-BA-01309]|uniref:BppU family phage baseplate upper protein n=1 Tax=Bacillus cereus group sp. BfR-BA-01309 TaxID=2920286 RepID=UPI001F57A012|nr:BppU family phage baseplate upper protein [Bacillus cereus group sp. BfR-BA-01309]
MRNETVIIDLSSPSLAKTIYSRQNDKNGLKLTVYLREYGKPVDLTGYAVKYEAAGQSSNFVRVDAKVTDATKGIFEYIFSKEAVSTSSLWLAYFAFEKGEERFTTQDLKIVLGSDVKEGSIQIENYIAEFDKLKKQIDALQIAVDKADVVKRSGGTMTGNLSLDRTDNTVTRDLRWTTGGSSDVYVGLDNAGLWRAYATGLGMIFSYNKDTKEFNVPGSTNLLKKSGDTMTGDLKTAGSAMFDSLGSGIVQGGGASSLRWRMYQSSNGECSFVPSTTVGGSDWDWNKAFRIKPDGTINQTTDTNWTNLTLINGVTNQSGKTSQIKRTGNTVCLNMNVIGVKNNHIIASLPANFRPVRDLTFSATYVLNNLDTNTGFITLRADGSVHCEWIAEGTNPLKYWSFTLTYII